jgi:hypothetical protein
MLKYFEKKIFKGFLKKFENKNANFERCRGVDFAWNVVL